MERTAYERIEDLAREPGEMERSVEYVASNLAQFLKRQEQVIICFPRGEFGRLGEIFTRAVCKAGAIPLVWGPDFRWKSLLRLAFNSRATVIIGPPLVILGLSKLVRATGTPLNIRNVVTAGYPCPDWMIDGIIQGLDCETWGCFTPGAGAVVGGFSCRHGRGIHLRQEAYRVHIVDDRGETVPPGSAGRVVVSPAGIPTVSYPTLDGGRLDDGVCDCGDPTPRLVDITFGCRQAGDIEALNHELQSWTSILDCRLVRGIYGLEMELVVFPGEKLPKLPTCAKRIIRRWDPERDEPFFVDSGWVLKEINAESH